jgi:hypothetical protein
MLDRQKSLEREVLLKRNREIRAELAQFARNIRELEAQLPIEEQLCLKLRRFKEAKIPKLTGELTMRNEVNTIYRICATPAKLRKSTIVNSPVTLPLLAGSVGLQCGSSDMKELRSS